MTDRCTDQRSANLLHHYELGLLSDDERREFEYHLYECEHCFEKVRRFEQTARLLSHDPDVRESVQRLAERQTETAAERKESRRLRIWPTIIPITVAAAALLLLILKPWHVEIQPTREAIARENRLAIMYFDNLADREDSLQLGEIATNLLITDLAESAYFQVVSGQRLYDILKLLGNEGQKSIDRDIARQVADTARADLIILGNILQIEPHLVLTSQLIESSTGKVLASQRITGKPGENIFAMIDQLTAQIRSDLSLPEEAAKEADRRIAEVTTRSADAYRFFLEGLDYQRKFYLAEATASFARAVEFDSTFAMAYYHLAGLVDGRLIDKAMAYLDHAGRRDQFYIKSRKALYSRTVPEAIAHLQTLLERYPDEKEALFSLGRLSALEQKYDRAIQYLREALVIDPLYESVYNELAYLYTKMDEYEKAIEAINTYISLAPDQPNPYDTRGEIYLKNGRIEQAVESFRMALRIEPGFANSRWNLAYIHFLRQEYAAAEGLFQEFARDNDPLSRTSGRLHLALIPLAQGKFTRSLQALDENLATYNREGITDALNFDHFIKAVIHTEQDDFELAEREFQLHLAGFRAVRPQSKSYDRNIFVQLLAEGGNLAEAERVAESLKDDLKQAGESPAGYWYASGCIEMAKANPDSAIILFQKTLQGWTDYPVHFMLAKAYLEAGRLAEAVSAFEAVNQRYSNWRVFWCIWSAKAHYYLGLAYERSRWHEKAIEQYQAFLEIWKDADPGIEEIEDAKARLAHLKASS